MTNISIQPSKIEIQLKPGALYVQSYIIKNSGDQSIILNTSTDSWLPQGSQGNVSYLNYPPNINLSLSNSDIKLGQTFILGPNQSKQLVLKIEATQPGDHYFTFFISQDSSSVSSTNSSQLIRIGSHLLISVSESEIVPTKLNITNFKVNNPFIDCFFSNVKFTGLIHNQSDYFNQANGDITISKNSNITNKLTIYPDTVLSQHNRSLRCLNEKSPIDCQLNRPLWPGIYQATALNQTISFVILPYSLLTFVLLISIVIKLLIDSNHHPKL
ncbi:MAG: hypothetical protein WC069_00040 [Candidatus Shapirobacteria bacterium]